MENQLDGMDITNLRKTADALEREKNNLRRILEAIPEGVCIIDANGRIEYANPAIQNEFGPYDGRKCYDYLRRKCGSCAWCQTADTQEGVKMMRTEFTPPDTEKTYDIIDIPFQKDDGSMSKLKLIRDVTEQIKAHDILKKDKEAVEQLAREKTEELSQVKSALDEAKRLSDIGTLAATVSHELRNPLGVIRAAVYNINRKNTNPALEKNLFNIEKKIQESEQIINNLLFYTRIKKPNFEKINLFDLLEECFDSAKKRFSGKIEADVSLNIHSLHDFILSADPFQLREVFNNIINNAFQSLETGRGRIDAFGEVDSETNMVRVHISDSGVGIGPEDLKKVFDPFFTNKSKGTGLGLTICRDLIGMHNGSVEIKSAKGQGTTVSVILPYEKNTDH